MLYIKQKWIKAQLRRSYWRISSAFGLEIIKRNYVTEAQANYIFTGQRRAGKTFFVFSLIQEMIKNGMSVESVLYINFEDERLIGLDVSELDTIAESYHEMFSSKPVLFLMKYKILPDGRNLPEGWPTPITAFILPEVILKCLAVKWLPQQGQVYGA